MAGGVGEIVQLQILHSSPDTNLNFSSGEIANVTAAGCTPPDVGGTLINWPRVKPMMDNAHNPGSTSSVGLLLDSLPLHPGIGVPLVGAHLVAAAVNVRTTVNAIQRTKERDSYKAMYKALNNELNGQTAHPDARNVDSSFAETKSVLVSVSRQRVDFSDVDLNKKISNLNTMLEEALKLKKNKELKARYTSIRITTAIFDDTGAGVIGWNVEMIKQPEVSFWRFWDPNSAKAPWLIRKAVNVADTMSDAIGLASFAYWLLFIGGAVFTGAAAFAGIGILGVANWFAFGVPLAVGGLYAGWKLKNQIAHRNRYREDHDVFNKLLRQVLFDNEADSVARERRKVAPYKIVIGPAPASPKKGTVYVSSVPVPGTKAHGVYYQVITHTGEGLQATYTGELVAKAISADTDISPALRANIMGCVVNTPAAHASQQTEVSNSNNKAGIINAAILALLLVYATWQYSFWLITDVVAKMGVAVDAASWGIGLTIFLLGGAAFIRTIVTGVVNGYKEFKNTSGNEKKGFGNYIIESVSNGLRDALAMVVSYFTKKREHRSDYFELDSTIQLRKQTEIVRKLRDKLNILQAQCTLEDVKVPPLFLNTHLEQLEAFERADQTPSHWQRIRNVFHVGYFGTTGVYLARTVLVKNTTSFLLPWMTSAACLANPITVGLLIGIGITFGLYRYYHYRKERNEKKLGYQNEMIDLMEKQMSVLENLRKTHSASKTTARMIAQRNSNGGVGLAAVRSVCGEHKSIGSFNAAAAASGLPQAMSCTAINSLTSGSGYSAPASRDTITAPGIVVSDIGGDSSPTTIPPPSSSLPPGANAGISLATSSLAFLSASRADGGAAGSLPNPQVPAIAVAVGAG